MDRQAVCISLAILALVLLAGPGAKAAELVGGTASIDGVRQLMPSSSSMRLGDGVAPELAVVSTVVDLGVHRRVLAGIDPGPLNGNKQACRPKCAQPGQPNTGRNCLKIYRCLGGN
ncbi:uncharacterized protein [Aegilops tauschii subsp. strangulata]|uniref:Uncharacterized protein n=1 Tax=Aegilops tauschii subsp. strangulata TaxID=200361 RepID=A0A453GP60_AEGTS|nr:uncharacterized protein LOC109783556 [Aegilops tauschii subsp. strangulata]